MTRTRKFALVAVVAALLPISTQTLAGDLDPPAGPVAPTMKDLDQVEPRIPISAATTPGDADGTPSAFKITQPGSYYLTGNITVVGTQIGIEVAASNVSLDLMGFRVNGPGSNGILFTGSQTNVAIRNGTIANWNSDGINATSFGTATGVVIERIAVWDNGNDGVQVGNRAIIRDCTAEGNGFSGLTVGSNSLIYHSLSVENGTDGIVCGVECYVTECSVNRNTADGIEFGSRCRITNNHGNVNGLGAGTGAGLHSGGTDSLIDSNTMISNDTGIDLDSSGNIVMRNTAAANTINYDLVANNKVGVIVSAPNSAAIAGSTGGAGLGTTDPWANFSY
jgi:parallel beta-helix repeat protein